MLIDALSHASLREFRRNLLEVSRQKLEGMFALAFPGWRLGITGCVFSPALCV